MMRKFPTVLITILILVWTTHADSINPEEDVNNLSSGEVEIGNTETGEQDRRLDSFDPTTRSSCFNTKCGYGCRTNQNYLSMGKTKCTKQNGKTSQRHRCCKCSSPFCSATQESNVDSNDGNFKCWVGSDNSIDNGGKLFMNPTQPILDGHDHDYYFRYEGKASSKLQIRIAFVDRNNIVVSLKATLVDFSQKSFSVGLAGNKSDGIVSMKVLFGEPQGESPDFNCELKLK